MKLNKNTLLYLHTPVGARKYELGEEVHEIDIDQENLVVKVKTKIGLVTHCGMPFDLIPKVEEPESFKKAFKKK